MLIGPRMKRGIVPPREVSRSPDSTHPVASSGHEMSFVAASNGVISAQKRSQVSAAVTSTKLEDAIPS